MDYAGSLFHTVTYADDSVPPRRGGMTAKGAPDSSRNARKGRSDALPLRIVCLFEGSIGRQPLPDRSPSRYGRAARISVNLCKVCLHYTLEDALIGAACAPETMYYSLPTSPRRDLS